MEALRCCYCNRIEAELPPNDDLRPYGPGGQPTCYACAMETPERAKVAEGRLAAKFAEIEAAGDIPATASFFYGVQPMRRRDG